MAAPIVNDWKAINDRIQQIKSEQSACPCGRCGGLGWMPRAGKLLSQRGYMFSTCDNCGNPNDLLPPDL
jgi:hypothetical protein